MKSITAWGLAALLAAALCCLPAAAQVRVATDASGKIVHIDGSVVVIEPDIELSLVTAGGLAEPRKEWSETARKLYPQAVRTRLGQLKIDQKPDYDVPDELAADSRLGQIIRLNEAVATSISQYSIAGSALATKKDAKGRPRMDWTLGPGVSELREATGADYGLFTYVRDSYTSGGRAALRALTMLAGFAIGSYIDIGGGAQVGVATLVDLRTGQVVWFNLMTKQTGDLRDEKGATATVSQLLKDMPQ